MTKDSTTISLPVKGERPTAIRRSKNAPRRAAVLIVVQLLMIAHVVQWLMTGRTISPIEPSESMEAVKHGVINAGAIFFALALLSTLVLGRWFCGWGCHLVMLQDFCGWIMRKLGVRPKPFRSRLLIYVPFILALYMFVWPAVQRWGVIPLSQSLHARFDWIPALPDPTPWTGLSVEVMTDDFWRTFAGVAVAIPFLLVCGFATVYFLGNKGFCTYGCPYGGFFAPFEQYAPGRVRVTDACRQCGHCTAVCTSNVRVHEEVKAYGMVVDPGCMKTSDCISVCPNDALYFGFGAPAAMKGRPKHETKRTYDLTWPEEIGLAIVFLASFLAWRGIYQVVPMLMAVGVAGCVTYIAWKAWRLLRAPNVNLHRWRLKMHGRVQRAGVVFAGAAAIVLLLTVHSGLVTTFARIADRADRAVTIPKNLVFVNSPMELPPAQAAAAERGLRFYRLAGPIGEGGIGLLTDPENLVRRAWLEATRHDFAEAERLLHEQVRRFGETQNVCRDLASLMRLQLDDRRAEAYYADVLGRHAEWVFMRDDQLLALVNTGRTDEAIEICRAALDAVEGDDERLYLMRRLSLLLVDHGDLDEGIEVFEQTIEIDDANPASYVMLSRAYVKRGDDSAAADALLRALELRPGQVEVMFELVDRLRAAGRELEASVWQEQAEAARAAEVERLREDG